MQSNIPYYFFYKFINEIAMRVALSRLSYLLNLVLRRIGINNSASYSDKTECAGVAIVVNMTSHNPHPIRK